MSRRRGFLGSLPEVHLFWSSALARAAPRRQTTVANSRETQDPGGAEGGWPRSLSRPLSALGRVCVLEASDAGRARIQAVYPIGSPVSSKLAN